MKHYWIIIACLVHLQPILGQICETYWLPYNDQFVRYFEERVVHSVAKERCQFYAGQLISCSNAKDVGILEIGRGNHSVYWCNNGSDDSFNSHLRSQIKQTTTIKDSVSRNSSNEKQCRYIQNMTVQEDACDQPKGYTCVKNFTLASGICHKGAVKIGGNCWWQNKNLLDLNNSRKACAAKGGRLAILETEEKLKYGIAAVKGKNETFWVGAKVQNSQIKWNNGQTLDLNTSRSSISVRNNSGIYVRLSSDSTSSSGAAWILENPNITAYAFCEEPFFNATVKVKPSESYCPESSIEEDGICYWISSDRKDWMKARKYCQASAGDLISYKNKAEEEILTKNSSTRQEKMWIGLRRHYGSRDFNWSDGSNGTYENWAPGQPTINNRLCGARDEQNGRWEVADCTSKLLFMCKASAGVCGGRLTNNGTFHSPNYPKSYGPNLNCTWTITVAENHKVDLQFTFFEIEDSRNCEKDFVKVFDGHEPNAQILGKYCANNNPGIILSSENEMSIHFVTDEADDFKGFSAIFKQGPCGESFYSNNGTFQSPNYPNAYPLSLKCTWNITVPEGQIVVLQFKTFLLENSENCQYDFVQVIDGQESNSTVLGKYCGDSEIGMIYSTGNKMSVVFVTEKGTTEPQSGFSAMFTQGKLCPKPKQSDNPIWWNFQGSCYFIPSTITYKLTWANAEQTCIRQGANLASIHSVKELDDISYLHPKSMRSWLGLRTKNLNTSQVWTDGTNFDFATWDKDQKYNSNNTNICISFDTSTKLMRANNCNDLLSIICKFKLNTTDMATTEAPKLSSLNPCPEKFKAFGTTCVPQTDTSTIRSTNSVFQSESSPISQSYTSTISQSDTSTVSSTSSISNLENSTISRTSSISQSEASTISQSNTTTISISVNSGRKEATLVFSVGIPVTIACLVIIFLVVWTIRRPKGYARLRDRTLEFINPRVMENNSRTSEITTNC